jgi:hypothetical protein
MQALRVLVGVGGVLIGAWLAVTAISTRVAFADMYLGFGLVYLQIGVLTLIWAAEKAKH